VRNDVDLPFTDFCEFYVVGREGGNISFCQEFKKTPESDQIIILCLFFIVSPVARLFPVVWR